MIANGWESEARRWYPDRDQAGLQTVGYNEWFSYFDGKISRDEAVKKIKIYTRRYAKRQITWFKKYGDWKEFHPDEYAAIVSFIEAYCKMVNSY
jgi:tRNA dimethylallyltransferase